MEGCKHVLTKLARNASNSSVMQVFADIYTC